MRIRLIITHTGLTDTAFAQKISTGQTTLSNMFLRDSDPKAEILQSIIKIFNVNPSWLLTGEGEMFVSTELQSKQTAMQKIPLLRQRVSCGPGQSWEEEQNVAEFVDITDLMPLPHVGKLYGFRVSGSSMIGAGVRNGDIVLFNPSPDQDMGEGLYVFSLDGDVYCKLLKFEKLARRIHFYSMHSSDIEKAELLRTVDTTDTTQVEHLHIFGRVAACLHTMPRDLPYEK